MLFLARWGVFTSAHAQLLLYRGIMTLAVVVAAVVVNAALKKAVQRHLDRGRLKRSGATLLSRLIGGFVLLFTLLALSAVWGVGMENLWVALTGIIGLVAIGFFAVWSLLSNIVAGLLLVVTKPFRAGDRIQIVPDGIEGEVVEIATLFVVLQLGEKGVMYLPNNMVFQKAIVNLGQDAVEQARENQAEGEGQAESE